MTPAEIAKAIIDAIPEALGITPDPWPEQPDAHDGEPHRTVERIITADRAQQEAEITRLRGNTDAFTIQAKEALAAKEAEITRLTAERDSFEKQAQIAYKVFREHEAQLLARAEAAEASLAQQEQEIQRLKAQSTWQPIATAPKDAFQTVLGCRYVSATDYEMRTTHWDDMESAWMKDRAYFDHPTAWQPTHWQPLPPPPVIETGHHVAEGGKET